MTHSLVIGEIVEIHRNSEEFSFEWRIYNFWQFDDNWYTSPPFSFCNACWSLNMDLNGMTWTSKLKSRDSGPGHLELFMGRNRSGPTIHVNFTFAIKVADGVEKKVQKQQRILGNGGVYFPEFCLMSDLRNKKSRLVPDDVLTITCTLKSDAQKISLPKSHGSIICSLKAVLSEGRYSDFTVKVEDREWHVHKMILASRSEYFASMLSQEWRENKTGEARFDDISKDVMNNILLFIYTGEVEDVTVDNICELFIAAHKFLLEDLKPLCVYTMIENMGSDIVCEALDIGRIYEEKDLVETALDCLTVEGEKIFHIQKWKQFEQNNPSIAEEIKKKIRERRLW